MAEIVGIEITKPLSETAMVDYTKKEASYGSQKTDIAI